MRGLPLLAGLARELAGGGHVEGPQRLAVALRVAVDRITVVTDPEAVAARALAGLAAEHPEEVVVGVVLHHQHDHVLDLGQRVGACRQIGVR